MHPGHALAPLSALWRQKGREVPIFVADYVLWGYGTAAIMAVLVVSCLKGITPLTYPYGLPELISVAVVVVLHLWKRNTLASIALGTVCYMILVQMVF